MKIMRARRFPAMLAFLAAALLSGRAFGVEYRVEFEGTWNGSQVEGGSLPDDAHFTTLIGATHEAGSPLWVAGGLATVGIERVAELGSTGVLTDEIQAHIAAGDAGEQISVDGLSAFPSSTQSTFEIDEAHPNVTLISMIAPSPDWFVGVSDVSLRSGGAWLPSLTVDLHPYDAGTEEGSDFDLTNPRTDPHEPIGLVGGTPFVGNPVVGRVHFTFVPPFDCPAAPASGCVVADTGVLVISEKAAGKEKLKAVFAKLQSTVVSSDFGDPVEEYTAYKLCVFDGASALVGEYTVDRGGETCVGSPCFRALGPRGFRYKDKALVADGVGKMNLLGGPAGKGRITVVAKNKEGTMPTGVAAALLGTGGATAQFLARGAGCFEADLSVVKKSDGVSFKGVTP